MYDTILLPVAPGGKTDAAIPHVHSLAATYEATVHVVAAVDTVSRTLSGSTAGTMASRVERGARNRVESVSTALESAAIEVIGDVVHGAPLRVIENAIEANGVDLVVMPTHSRTGLQRVLLGSVTEKAVRTLPVPVLTVPIPDTPGKTADDSDADADGADVSEISTTIKNQDTTEISDTTENSDTIETDEAMPGDGANGTVDPRDD